MKRLQAEVQKLSFLKLLRLQVKPRPVPSEVLGR